MSGRYPGRRRALDGCAVHETPKRIPRTWPRFMLDLAAHVAAHKPLFRTVDPARDLAKMMRQEAAATLERP